MKIKKEDLVLSEIPDSDPDSLGNKTITLSTRLYEDAKYFFKKAFKLIAAGVICVVLYYMFGWWVFASALIFSPVAWFTMPWIAEKFMSYISLVAIALHKDRPDEVMLVQFPYDRFAKAFYLDDAGQKSALHSPFNSVAGPTYIVDDIEYKNEVFDTDLVPGGIARRGHDHIIINPVHRNIEFTLNYVPAFIDLRKDLIHTRNENFALKSYSTVVQNRVYIDRLSAVIKLFDTVFSISDIKDSDELKSIKAQVIELKEALGLKKPKEDVEEVEL